MLPIARWDSGNGKSRLIFSLWAVSRQTCLCRFTLALISTLGCRIPVEITQGKGKKEKKKRKRKEKGKKKKTDAASVMKRNRSVFSIVYIPAYGTLNGIYPDWDGLSAQASDALQQRYCKASWRNHFRFCKKIDNSEQAEIAAVQPASTQTASDSLAVVSLRVNSSPTIVHHRPPSTTHHIWNVLSLRRNLA